jgi:hypothetical protein
MEPRAVGPWPWAQGQQGQDGDRLKYPFTRGDNSFALWWHILQHFSETNTSINM